ncbi:MAG: sigma 54-interacting transcriptional regulator [Acidobacteria bacterium]|nr:sigma 54-interacting transcriptional regulator [Acidobacteriota bacterium]
MEPRIKISYGPGAGQVFVLKEDVTTIGREVGNSIILKNSSVSRRHCVIERRDNAFAVSDLGSLNGTLINGVNAAGAILKNGDEMKVGDFTFRFSDRESDAPSSSLAIDVTEFRLPKDSVRIAIDEVFGAMARDLTAILKISTTINTIRDAGELETAMLELIFEVVPADSGAIVTVDDDLAIVRSAVSNRLAPNNPVIVSQTVIDRVLRERAVLLVPEVEPNSSESLFVSKTRSLVAVPMIVFERPLGVIYLASSTATFDESHIRFLTAVASIGGVALDNAGAWANLADENERLRNESFGRNMLGESDSMQRVFAIIRKVAPTGSTVLIDGESGTGKELAAQSIHQNSARRSMPFVAINCAALTETLLESELFGHEKGAFTGAVAQKRGKIEMAAGGTLFLDEIGEMNIVLQAKLLRVLQEREFERVGGTRPIRADIRLIAATNRDLNVEVANGRFRQDLFYRLNVVRFTMPALRDRPDDIPMLAKYFADKFGRQMNRRLRGISSAASKLLAKYEFPGNVRELENSIERAVVLGSGEWILPEDLPDDILETRVGESNLTSSYHDSVRETKRSVIAEAFRKSNGSYVETAKLLGVHPNYLHRLIRNLEMKEELERHESRL